MYYLTQSNPNIPEWLRENINTSCPYCGTPLFDNDILTQRFCPNPSCPGHLAQRCDTICKYFNIKNVGPATALSMIKSKSLQNTYEFIREVFKGEKPEVELWEVAKLGGIYGIDTKFRELLIGYSSFEEYFDTDPNVHPIMAEDRDYLIYGQQFFKIKRPLSKRVINVMMTGSIDGFTNRKDFIRKCNDTFGHRLQVIEVGKRATNVQYLIKEKTTVDHSKSALALKHGIPIVTPMEFLYLVKEVYLNED